MSLLSKASILALIAAVTAQQTEYGQCGGIGWTGPTTCVSPYACIEGNPYYYQCLPGSSTTTTTTTTTSSSKTSTGSGGTSSTSTSTSTTSTTTTSHSLTTTTSASTLSDGLTPLAKSTTTSTFSTSIAGCPTVVGSPFTKSMIANSYYANEISTAVAAFQSQGDTVNAAKAASVAEIPTFIWLDQAAKVPSMASYLEQAGSEYIAPFVVYDLPDRDCAAAASNGEFTVADNGVELYMEYIDNITAQINAYPDTTVVLVIEPDSLPNLVTNLDVAECAAAEDAYLECIEYAIKTLNLPNVYMYIDAGHAGWLGWSSNVGPAAQLFAQVWQAAGSPTAVRGLATNTANYNAFDNGGVADSITSGDPATDEKQYIAEIAPLLCEYGFPAHFITDTGRNGVQDIRFEWGDWCNVLGAGFGIRPTTNTGDNLVDAFVWIKPGGECDGTSNTSSSRYDYHCTLEDAMVPAPEAGTWFEAYFENLVKYANPPL